MISGGHDLSGLNDLEMESYLPFGTDNEAASASTAKIFGYDPTSGNPFNNILRNASSDIAEVAKDYLATTYGDMGAGQRNLSQETVNALSQGKTNYLSAEQGRSMLDNIYNMMNNKSAKGLNQLDAERRYSDFNSAFQGYLGAMGAGISPAIRNNSNAMNALLRNMKSRYNEMAPSGNYNPLGFILGKY